MGNFSEKSHQVSPAKKHPLIPLESSQALRDDFQRIEQSRKIQELVRELFLQIKLLDLHVDVFGNTGLPQQKLARLYEA